MGYVPTYDYNEHEDYDMEPIVTELSPLPEAVQASAVEVIREILGDKDAYDFNVAGGHVFERKGQISSDQLAGHRNPSYGSAGDDVVLQITIRVRPEQASDLVEEVAEARIAELEAEQNEKERELNDQISRLKAEQALLEGRRSALKAGRY